MVTETWSVSNVLILTVLACVDVYGFCVKDKMCGPMFTLPAGAESRSVSDVLMVSHLHSRPRITPATCRRWGAT